MVDVDLKPVYLLTGSDRPKVEVALERLRTHFAPEAVERVSAIEASGSEIVSLCNTGSLFGDRRLVVVSEVDGRKRDDGRLTGGWKAADVETVLAYLQAPAPDTVLALVADALKKDAPLAKAVAKVGQILAWDVPKRQLNHWIAERFRDRGVRAEPDACAMILQLVGDDLHQLAAEIDKVALWAAGEPVGEAEIEQLVAPSADTPVFAFTDAWGRRETAKALAAAETYVDRSGRPRSVSIPILANALSRQVGVVRKARRLDRAGVPARDALKELGVRFDFQAQRAYQAAGNYGERELDEALVRLARLDHAIKGGSRLAPELELQLAVADATRPPGQS